MANTQAQVVTESFMNSTATGWVMAGTGYTPNLTSGGVDPTGAGWLRLTDTGGNEATSAYYNTAFSSANATIYASFEYASWGGNGADGMTFFLYDGSKTFGVGADGGSLGYAQKTIAGGGGTNQNGLNGGYLGIALDEFGNFSNPTEGRQGGTGFAQDAFVVRGPGQGLTGYDYLGGSGTLSTSIDSVTRPVTPNTVQVLISATNQLTVTLQQAGSSFATVLSLDLSGYARPDTLKFGFAAGTGGQNNYHEIRNLNVTTLTASLWDGGAGDGLWGSANNWDPNIMPAAGSDILFDNTFVSTAQTINTGANRTVRSLQFDSPDGYTINNNTLTFNAGSVPGFTGIAVTNTRGNADETVNSALSLANNIGIRQNSSGTLNLNGGIALGTYTAAFDGMTGTTTVTGVISGVGNVTKADSGTVNLNAANTYSGGTTVSGGTLSTNNAAGFGTGAITLAGGTLASSNNSTVANTVALTGNAAMSNITTSGTLTQIGGDFTLSLLSATQSGTVNLSNNNTAHTLTAQVDAGTSTISGVIANGGTSAGNLTKTGSGDLVLSGNNTYTGTTTINGGSLMLGASDRLADASGMNIGASGIFNLNGFSEKVGTLTAAGGATLNFGATSGANTFIFGTYVPPASGVLVVNNWESALDKLATTVATQNVSSIYISGFGVAQEAAGLSAMGGSYGNAYLLTPVAVSTVEWDGSSSNAWNTNNNWTPAAKPTTTQVAKFGALGLGQLAVNLNGNNTIAGLQFASAATNSYNITGANTLTLAGTVPYIQQQSASNQTIGVTTLALSNNTVADITGAGNLSISSVITGTGFNIIKDGTGTGKLILSGANTFSGGVFINNGIVQAASTGALGTGAATVSTGATLELSGGFSRANAIAVTGTGVGSNGAIRNVNGTNTLSGTITEIGATTIVADTATTLNLTGNLTGANTDTTFAGAGNIAVSGITTGTAGVTLNGTGTVTFNGAANANTYTGLTTLNSGTLLLSKNNGTDAIGTGGLQISGGTARLAAGNQINDTATVTVSAGTFDLNGQAETIKALAGSTGTTVALGAGSLTINGSNGQTDYAGAFTGTGASSLNKSGTGMINLTGSSSGLAGAVNLSAGIIKVSGTAANMLGTGAVAVTGTGNLEIQDGATLANALTLNSTGTNGNGAVQNLTGNNTVSGNVTLTGASRVQSDTGTLALTGATVTLGANTLTVGGDGNASIANVISGTGGLAKDGAGTLTVSGANSFTGATAINAGTLRLASSNRLSDTTAVTVAGSAVFDLNNNSDTIGSLAGAGTVTMGSGSLVAGGNASTTTFSGTLSGTGAFTKLGAGALTLSGANSYTGGTSITAGTLNADNASALSTGTVTLNGGTLASTVGTTAANTVTLSGNSGLSNITTSGTLTQSGANRILTMDTATQSGTVNLSESATARTLTVQVASGTSVISGTINNGGGSTGSSLTKTGAGTLELSSANGYNGTTTISAGVLNANNNTALGTSAVTLSGGTLASTTGATVGNALTLTGNSGLSNITTSGTLTQSGANRILTLDGATQSGAVNLSNNATARILTVQVAGGTSTINGVIANGGGSATGSLTKTGFGELVLGGANTYSGTTTISGGTVTLGGSNRLLDTSAVNIGATGTLNLAGNSEKVGTLTATGGAALDFGTTSGANTFIFGTYVPPASGVLVVNNWESALDKLATTVATQNVSTIYISGYGVAQEAAGLSAMGGIYGNAYLLTPVAAPTVEWDGSSSAAWNTAANWTPAAKPTTTQIALFNSLGVGRAAVTLDGNNTVAGVKFGSGATVSYNITGANTLTLAGTVPYIQQQSANNQTIGVTALALSANSVVDITGAGNLTISSAITGAARNLIKDGTGAGKLILSGANTFSGGLFINNGVVQAASTAALGTGTTTVYDGGTLELSGGVSPTNTVTVTGTGFGGNGAIRNVGGTNTLSGTITETGATTIAADTGTTLNLTGNLTGTNINTTFAGAGSIAAGRITTGTGAVAINSTGTVTYNGGTNANTYTGLTTVNAGTLLLSKTAGTDAIGTGGLLVSGGTARLAAGEQINNTATVTVNSGTFDLNGQTETIKALAGSGGTVALGAGTLAINGSTSTSYAGAFTGTGASALNQSGTGTLTLSGSSSGMAGAVNLSAGSINVSGAAANILGTGTVAVTGTGNLEMQGGATLANAVTLNSTGTAGNGAVQNLSGSNTLSGAVTLAGASRLQSDAGTLTVSGAVALGANTLTVGGSGNTSASGVISGTGNLVKDGTGALTLTGGGSNSYLGTTAVNDGTLNLNKTPTFNALGVGAITVGDGSGAAGSANLVLLQSNQISDSAAITINSDGRFAINNTFTESIATIAGTGLVDLSTSGYLIVGANNSSSTFGGSLTGAGTLEKAGTGLLTFNSTINYAGTLTLSGGTLRLNGTSATIGTLNVTGNTTIDFAGINATLDLTTLTIADGVTLNITNWANAADYFFTDNWTNGGTGPTGIFNTRGTDPMNQITFNGFAANQTVWQSYDHQITPVPEPATYGALLLGAGLVVFGVRRLDRRRLRRFWRQAK